MFRLIASRVNEIVPFQACVLYSLDNESRLNVRFASGKNSVAFSKVSIGCDEGLAGKSLFGETIEHDPSLRSGKTGNLKIVSRRTKFGNSGFFEKGRRGCQCTGFV